MKDKSLFEIPVYRCAPEEYLRECEKEIQRHHEWLYRTSGASQEEVPRIYRLAEERIHTEYGHWRYNQVVGWIRLLAITYGIRGEYYFVEAKRIHKNVGNKKMIWRGKAFELRFIPEQSSDDIYGELCGVLKQLQKDKPFKSRFLDMELFQSIGPHMNWRELIETGG